MKRFLLVVLLFPVLALAQDTTPDVPVNVPQSSTFWTAFIMVVGLPFLAKALNLVFDMFLNWRKAKGDKRAEAYARIWALAGDAVAFVNAKTKATRDLITSPGSEGGTKVTATEAKQYQDEARAALIEWLGTEGFKAAAAEIGIAAGKAEEWVRGLIQKRFEAQNALDGMASAPAVVVNSPAVP